MIFTTGSIMAVLVMLLIWHNYDRFQTYGLLNFVWGIFTSTIVCTLAYMTSWLGFIFIIGIYNISGKVPIGHYPYMLWYSTKSIFNTTINIIGFSMIIIIPLLFIYMREIVEWLVYDIPVF